MTAHPLVSSSWPIAAQSSRASSRAAAAGLGLPLPGLRAVGARRAVGSSSELPVAATCHARMRHATRCRWPARPWALAGASAPSTSPHLRAWTRVEVYLVDQLGCFLAKLGNVLQGQRIGLELAPAFHDVGGF